MEGVTGQASGLRCYSMIRPEVIHLLIPTCRPEIPTNEFDAVERPGEVWFSVTQPRRDVPDGISRTSVEREHVPFGDVRADVHPNCL